MRDLGRFARPGAIALIVAAACAHDATSPGAVVTLGALRFVAQPADHAAGDTFTVSVELLDSAGVRAPSAINGVTIKASDGTNIVGPLSVAASSGVATFRALTITKAVKGITLIATSDTTSVSSSAFTVNPAAASAAHTTTSLATTNIAPTDPTPATFTFKDKYDNVVAGASLNLMSSLAGSVFTPSTGTTRTDGTFATSFVAPNGGSASITATIGGAAITLTPAWTVCPMAPLTVPGTVNATLTAGQCVFGAMPTAFYRFTTAAAGGAAFAITSAFTPRLEVKTDPPALNAFALPAQGATTEWLLPAGTYQVRVGATSGSGAFAVNATSVPANTGCVKRFLVTPGTYAGQALATGDCDLGDGSFTDKYVIYSTNPCSFKLQSVFTNYIFVYDHHPDGTVAGPIALRGGDTDPGVDLLVGLPACKNALDAIEIWVISNLGESGPYSLTFTLFPPPPSSPAALRNASDGAANDSPRARQRADALRAATVRRRP